MGLPLSRFQLMSGLFSGDRHCIAAIFRFKAVCIILPDPYDNRFKAEVGRRFMDIHWRTGKDMLFITFIEPPPEWSVRGKFVDFSIAEERNLISEEGSDDKHLISSFIRAVAPDTRLPAIIVTDDLLSGSYAILESSSTRFVDQLVRIGQFCSAADGRYHVTDSRFSAVLDTLGKVQYREDQRPLAASLADVFALQPDNYRHFSKEWADARLKELERQAAGGEIAAAVTYNNYQAAIKIAQKEPKLASSADEYSFTRPRSHSIEDKEIVSESKTFYRQYKIDEDGIDGFSLCDALSKDNIDQFNRTLRFFISKRAPSEDDIFYTDSEHTRVRSFMSLTCYISDFMEREINRSLIQQMRQCFGIEMPEFYARWKPNCSAVVYTGYNDVRLNMLKKPTGQLLPVMFGQAIYAYEKMSSPLFDPHIEFPLGDDFISLMKEILTGRNIADHAQYDPEDIMDYNRFRACYNAFNAILQRYLSKMMSIKQALMG